MQVDTMQQKQQSAIQNLLGFLLLALICAFIYTIIKILVDLLLELDPRVAAAIVAATATVLVSVFSVLISKFLEQRVKIIQDNRDKKIPVYEELINFVFKIVKSVKKGEQLPEDEMENFMFSFTEKIIVWGSDDILQKFYKFKNNNDTGDGREIALLIEDLLLAIRKDLGHSNKGLSQGKILGLFISDFDKYMAESSVSQMQASHISKPNRT
ncbi:hypothetical protein [Anabaena catenula]|uniref:Uncharacterized protein n=1 Tax=Anabaena catenula FACHB-362 TaxID=2692877 RepID=A0ABR8J9Z2_9NOST|nr:hypothetical protein [Anabaena catenula]MBD2694492.1 hypothetical protein [Anabaena catenula FACHB-362]